MLRWILCDLVILVKECHYPSRQICCQSRVLLSRVCPCQWRHREISVKAAIADRVWGCQCGQGSKPRLGVWRWSRLRPPEDETVYRFCLQKQFKIWKFRTIRLLILDQFVSRWGLNNMFWGLSPLAHAWCRHSSVWLPVCLCVCVSVCMSAQQYVWWWTLEVVRLWWRHLSLTFDLAS